MFQFCNMFIDDCPVFSPQCNKLCWKRARNGLGTMRQVVIPNGRKFLQIILIDLAVGAEDNGEDFLFLIFRSVTGKDVRLRSLPLRSSILMALNRCASKLEEKVECSSANQGGCFR